MLDHYVDLAAAETPGAAKMSAAQADAVREVERGLKRVEPSYRRVQDRCESVPRAQARCALGASTSAEWEACLRDPHGDAGGGYPGPPMKAPSVFFGVCTLVSVAACMHTPPPLDPSNAEDDSSGDDSPKKKKNPDAISPDEPTPGDSALGSSGGGGGSRSVKGEHATVKDEGDSEKVSCSGASFPNLMSVISKTACEVPKATPDNEKEKDVKDVLEVKASIDQPKVAPGGKANITLVFHNKGKADLALDFVADPEPHFELELYSLKGGRADNPPGAEPALPSSVSDQASAEKTVARVTLGPGGTATVAMPWDAVKYKWASADRAKGALPGQHYPREVAGPMPRGKYALKVVTPLIGVSEGVDHEISQPRIPVEVK